MFYLIDPYIVFAILFAIVMAITYAQRVSVKQKVIGHMEGAGCSEIKFPKNSVVFGPFLYSVEYMDRKGNKRKNRCVFMTGPFIQDGVFWEEPLNL